LRERLFNCLGLHVANAIPLALAIAERFRDGLRIRYTGAIRNYLREHVSHYHQLRESHAFPFFFLYSYKLNRGVSKWLANSVGYSHLLS